MTRPAKLALGLATLWPAIYFLFIIFVVLWLLFWATVVRDVPPQSYFDRFWVVILLHVVTTVWTNGLAVIYVMNVYRNDQISRERKPWWALAIFLGHSVAMPIYWYRYIWRENLAPSFGRRTG